MRIFSFSVSTAISSNRCACTTPFSFLTLSTSFLTASIAFLVFSVAAFKSRSFSSSIAFMSISDNNLAFSSLAFLISSVSDFRALPFSSAAFFSPAAPADCPNFASAACKSASWSSEILPAAFSAATLPDKSFFCSASCDAVSSLLLSSNSSINFSYSATTPSLAISAFF